MWFRESNRYFRNIENFAYGEISERSFSNPHPRSIAQWEIARLQGSGVNYKEPFQYAGYDNSCLVGLWRDDSDDR